MKKMKGHECMMHEWMRRANGIVGGSAYDKGTYDENVTHWKDRLESNGVDYTTILNGMDILSEDKTAFYAYVANGHSIEEIAEGLHRNGVRLKSTLKAIYEQLVGIHAAACEDNSVQQLV